jgi:hypothetical protein
VKAFPDQKSLGVTGSVQGLLASVIVVGDSRQTAHNWS